MTTQPIGNGASTGTATSWNARPSSSSMLALAASRSVDSRPGYSNLRAADCGLNVSDTTVPSRSTNTMASAPMRAP